MARWQAGIWGRILGCGVLPGLSVEVVVVSLRYWFGFDYWLTNPLAAVFSFVLVLRVFLGYNVDSMGALVGMDMFPGAYIRGSGRGIR